MNSLPTKRSQADLVEYMDTYVTYAEFRRLQEMDLDSDRLAWLESYMIQADENQTDPFCVGPVRGKGYYYSEV